MRTWISVVRNRRDGVAVLFAVSLLALLACGAIAIDLGMLFTARAEAQRVADSSALAGASAFKDFIPRTTAVQPAQDRANLYATENTIRGVKVDLANVQVVVDTMNYTVSTRVTSPNLGTWLARTFGITDAVVAAQATAQFAPVGGVKCVKPFAIPDMWDETDTNPTPPPPGVGQDVNANRLWEGDGTEGWAFEPATGDRYQKWNPDNADDALATGYHSRWRSDFGPTPLYDIGLTISVKSQNPHTNLGPGFFYPWRIGNSSGANDYGNNILGCHPATSFVGVPYRIEAGNMVNKTRVNVLALVALDAGASWDPGTQTVIGSTKGANWQNSPRVFIAGLFDPNLIATAHGAGPRFITFNDFGLFFMEGLDPTWGGPPPQAPVLARFLGFATGAEDGGAAGALNRRLRLIR